MYLSLCYFGVYVCVVIIGAFSHRFHCFSLYLLFSTLLFIFRCLLAIAILLLNFQYISAINEVLFIAMKSR